MKLYDTNTGVIVGEIITNHCMSIEEALELSGCIVDDEGQIFDEREAIWLDAWYENLDFED